MRKWLAFKTLVLSIALFWGQFCPAAANENMSPLKDMNIHTDKDIGYGHLLSMLYWHGYLDFEFHAHEGESGTFDNHELYLAAQAAISNRITLSAEFEFEHTPNGYVLPVQAYADFKVSSPLTIRFGQFFTPMGLPNTYTLRGNENRMIRQVALHVDLMFEDWIETGLNLYGDIGRGFFYDIAIANGKAGGLTPGDPTEVSDGEDDKNEGEDKNSNKSLHSRFGYNSAKLLNGEINLGFSYGTQKYDSANEKEMAHTGVDLRYVHKSLWRLQAEYMKRSGDDNEVDLAAGISAKALGWSAQVSKRFYVKNNKWLNFIEPAVQIDWIDLNTKEDTNQDQLTTAVALIYSPEPYFLVKFEYDLVKEQSGEKLANNVLWLAGVLEF